MDDNSRDNSENSNDDIQFLEIVYNPNISKRGERTRIDLTEEDLQNEVKKSLDTEEDPILDDDSSDEEDDYNYALLAKINCDEENGIKCILEPGPSHFKGQLTETLKMINSRPAIMGKALAVKAEPVEKQVLTEEDLDEAPSPPKD